MFNPHCGAEAAIVNLGCIATGRVGVTASVFWSSGHGDMPEKKILQLLLHRHAHRR